MINIKTFSTPIIAGKFKGKMILIPDISTTRSSKSILKESFFNTLQFDIIDKNFVEVFAGSGSVGLEALSRGAARVYFMEKNSDALEILRHNVARLEPQKCTIIKGNSFTKFEALYSEIKNLKTKTYFYFDPPFATRVGMEDIYDDTIALIKSLDRDVCEMAIIEHMNTLELPLEIGELILQKQKKFGKSVLSYYKFR